MPNVELIAASMRSGSALVHAAASCAAAALMGAAVAAPLALTEAQRLALERSPQMAAYGAAITAARDMAIALKQLRDPALELGVADLASPDQRAAAAERYARQADRAAVQKTATSVDIARETALAWLDCYYLEQMTRIAADQLKFGQLELDGAERLYWAGRLSQAEFYGARSMLVMFEDKSSELAHRGRAARIALKRWVGDAADAPLAALPTIDRAGLTPGGLEGDLARHPEVALLQTDEELAASELRFAQANRRSEREMALLVARRDEARAARDEKLREKVAETRIRIDEWQHARDRRDRYAREVVRLARERTLATLVAYRGGKAALTEVLAARRAETESQMQSVETEREAARIWARLNFSLPDALQTAPRVSLREPGAP